MVEYASDGKLPISILSEWLGLLLVHDQEPIKTYIHHHQYVVGAETASLSKGHSVPSY